MERTIFVCAYGDRVGGWPVSDRCACQYPDAVLCPPLQLIEQEAGGIEFDDGRLAVTATCFDDLQLVVYDMAVGALDRRWLPDYTYRCRTYRLAGYVAGRGARDYSGGG